MLDEKDRLILDDDMNVIDDHHENNASHSHVDNLCDKCGSPKNNQNKSAFLPPRIGRKRPQVNNTSFTQNALDRSEILQAAFVGNNLNHN